MCSPGSTDLENACREIHEVSNRSDRLARALARRTLTERQRIRETYVAVYGEDLADHLHRAVSADPKNEIWAALHQWMLDPHERDAVMARHSVEHIVDRGSKALVEIYACRKSTQVFMINRAYRARFKRNLDQDLISEPPHPYQRILVALATSHRSHHADTSQHIAKCDAKRLFEAGKGGTGAVDESVILELLSKRSIPQLRLAFSSYKCIYGHSYTKSLKKETCGEFEDSLRVVAKSMHDPPKYYSKMLYTSMKGTTGDKSALTRVMVSRAEVDMEEIKNTFQRKYGMKLHEAICESIQDGDYRDFLLALATTS